MKMNSYSTSAYPFTPLPLSPLFSLPFPSLVRIPFSLSPPKPSPDSSIRYKIGDSFFFIPLSEASSMLETTTSETSSEIESLEEKLSGVREEMEGLKAHLYARFGRGINLES